MQATRESAITDEAVSVNGNVGPQSAPLGTRKLPGFSEAGYCILPKLLDLDELEVVKSLASARADAPLPAGMSRPGNELHPLRWDDGIVATVLARDLRIKRLREALGVHDIRWLSAYVSSKPPRSPALAWHQDWWCWDDPVSLRVLAPQVALLCYLSDCDEMSGALRLIPGSHAQATTLHALLPEPHSAAGDALSPGHPALADSSMQVTVRVAAGDAVLIDYRLLHGTHRNDAMERRDCVLLSFLPEPNLLPGNLRSHLAMHPALPTAGEWVAAASAGHHKVIASFSEVPQSLIISRLPPAAFSQA